jgi:iron complex transport system permease protein
MLTPHKPVVSKDWLIFAGLLLLLAAMLAISLLAGRVWLPAAEVWRGLWAPRGDLAAAIVTQLRLPRAVLALEVGAALGLSGAALQGVTRNPLAEPGLLGVSSGAALGAVIAIYFGLAGHIAAAAPMAGLTGALLASLLTFALGSGGGTITLVLAGAAVSALAAAGISLALNLAPNPYAAYEIMTWLLGSLSDRSWADVVLISPFIILGAALLFASARALNALALGEEQARSLGINLRTLYALAIFGTALSVGAATAVTGAIGFIGLVAPHLVRPLVGYHPSRVLAPAALTGALLLLIADVATRVIPVGSELKLGVLTSLIGTPFFFWLVVRLRKVAPLLVLAALGPALMWPGGARAAASEPAAAGPQHVMSLSMCTDDLLLELLPPERIASVTYYARRPGNSRVWPQAARVAVNSGTAEEVLAAHPDLVLAGTYTTPATRRLLHAFNFALLEVPPANDFDEIRQITRRVAHELKRDAAAESLIASMDATLRSLSQTGPERELRVAGWGDGGSIPGRGTLFDAILRAAGGVNVAPSDSTRSYTSFDVEQLLAVRPDVIAYPSDIGDTPGRNTDVALHPLLMKMYAGKRVPYPSALYSCGTPASAQAAVWLREKLESAMGTGS